MSAFGPSPPSGCRIKICDNRLGANGFLNQRCALTPDLGSPAYGSLLGCVTAKRSLGQGWRMIGFGSRRGSGEGLTRRVSALCPSTGQCFTTVCSRNLASYLAVILQRPRGENPASQSTSARPIF